MFNICYTHDLKLILYSILVHLHFDCSCHLRAGVEFSSCVMSVIKKFQILKYFGFQIFGLGMLKSRVPNLQNFFLFFLTEVLKHYMK
jgi:hypothetical protein